MPLKYHVDQNEYQFIQYEFDDEDRVPVILQVILAVIRKKRKEIPDDLFFQNCFTSSRTFTERISLRHKINEGNWRVLTQLSNSKLYQIFDSLFYWLQNCVDLVISEQHFAHFYEKIVSSSVSSNEKFTLPERSCITLCNIVYCLGIRVFNTNCISIFNSLSYDLFKLMTGRKAEYFETSNLYDTRLEQVNQMIEIAQHLCSNPSTIVDKKQEMMIEEVFYIGTGGILLDDFKVSEIEDQTNQKQDALNTFLNFFENPKNNRDIDYKRAYSYLQQQKLKTSNVEHTLGNRRSLFKLFQNPIQNKFNEVSGTLNSKEEAIEDSILESKKKIEKLKKHAFVKQDSFSMSIGSKEGVKQVRKKSQYFNSPIVLPHMKDMVEIELVESEKSEYDSDLNKIRKEKLIDSSDDSSDRKEKNKLNRSLKEIFSGKLSPTKSFKSKKPKTKTKKRRNSSFTVSIHIQKTNNYFNSFKEK